MPVLIPTGGQKLALNGTDLSSFGVIVQSLAPLAATPKKRGKNVVVPGRHGTIRTPRKRFDEADVVLKCLVLGSQPDGTVPAGSSPVEEFYARADSLLSAFSAETSLLARTMPDGSVRQATVEVVDSMAIVRDLGVAPLIGEVNIALTIPGGFWTDAATVTQTITGATGVTATMSAFTGATAPMTDLTITFYGPINNPTITAGARYMQWNGAIPSGEQLLVTTANWQVGPGTGTAWSPDLRNITFGPGPEWFSLDPTANPFQTQLTHTGGGSASVTISGHRAFLSA